MAGISKPMQGRKSGTAKRNGRGSAGSDLDEALAYEYRRKVGAKLRDYRLRAEMTQAQLGDILGVGLTTISAIETGRSSLPPERYAAIVSIFGLDRKDFGKFLLRYTNPWLSDLVFYGEDKSLDRDLAQFPERIGLTRL